MRRLAQVIRVMQSLPSWQYELHLADAIRHDFSGSESSAGWRRTVDYFDLALETVARTRTKFGASPTNILAGKRRFQQPYHCFEAFTEKAAVKGGLPIHQGGVNGPCSAPSSIPCPRGDFGSRRAMRRGQKRELGTAEPIGAGCSATRFKC